MKKLIVLILTLLFFIPKTYALESTTVYTSPNKSVSGSIIWLDLATPKTQSLGVVQSTASYGFRFFIDKSTQIGKIYKIRLNFNDFDYLHSNTSNYWKIQGYSGTTLNGDCSLIGYELKNQGSNNQNKTVDVMYQCPTVNTGVMFYNEDLEGENLTRISTVSWRLNSIQWETIDTNQDIINNQTQNTQNVINNQNQNTQNLIDSQQSCTTYNNGSIKTNGYLWTNGTIDGASSTINGITDYININGATIQFLQNDTVGFYSCFYKQDKTVISCFQTNSVALNTDITIPNNAYYIRVSINRSSDKPQFKVCKNGNQAVSDSINGLNDNITDSNIDSSKATDTLNDLSNSLPTNSVISDLLLLPVSMLQAIVNSIGGTCSSFSLGTLYNTELVLPCIDIQSYLGNQIWTFIDIVFSALFVISIRKKFIQIFENITNLRNGGNEVE